MFSKKNENNSSGNSAHSSVNIFGKGTSIEGEIKSDGDIRVDGTIKGSVFSKSKIVIGATGHVDGEIYCQNADVSGKVEGSITVRELIFIKSTGKIEGEIKTAKLVVESGARFNGQCSMSDKELGNAQPKSTKTVQKEAV